MFKVGCSIKGFVDRVSEGEREREKERSKGLRETKGGFKTEIETDKDRRGYSDRQLVAYLISTLTFIRGNE